jgi:hypothetical protein
LKSSLIPETENLGIREDAWFQQDEALAHKTWCNKAAFLADISQGLNTINKSMQSKNKNIITCIDKINSVKEKPTL